MEQERTVAKEYLKIKKAWDDSKPKAPSIFLGRENDRQFVKAKVDENGNLMIQTSDRELVTVQAEKVMELAQWMRETYVDFSVAAQ